MLVYCLITLSDTHTHTKLGRTPLDEESARRNTEHLQRLTSIRQRNSNPQSHQANGRIHRP